MTAPVAGTSRSQRGLLPRDRANRRRRMMVTPEGLALPLTLASRGARLIALLLDLFFMSAVIALVSIALILTGINVFASGAGQGGLVELLMALWLVLTFLLRQGYFMAFELGPRGATPGKRLLGIRVAARDGGRLGAEAIIARNLLRDIEIFLPLTFIFAGAGQSTAAGWVAAAWFLIFALFPFFNADRLRAGDLIAGTWVVEAPRHRLRAALSTSAAAQGRSGMTGARYVFGEAELAVYGEHELQTLEQVLRDGRPETLEQVAQTICAKIGWSAGQGDERAFLEAYYAQLRARLERGMRFGQRKADKHS